MASMKSNQSSGNLSLFPTQTVSHTCHLKNQRNIGKIVSYIRKTYVELGQIKMHTFVVSEYFVFNEQRKLLLNCDVSFFNKEHTKNAFHSNVTTKIVTLGTATLLCINVKKCHFESQSLMFSIRQSFNSCFSSFNNLKHKFRAIKSEEFRLMLVDILSLVFTIRDQYISPSKFISVILSIYTLFRRYIKLFTPQTLGMNELFMGLSVLGLPQGVINSIKEFNLVTGKRLTDINVIMDLLSKMFDILDKVLTVMSDALPPNSVFSVIRKTLSSLFSVILCYQLIREVVAVNLKYATNPQIMFDYSFRVSSLSLYEKCSSNSSFREYIANNNNKFFIQAWSSFEFNLIKYAKTFDVSSRKEPLCIILEGPAGSGKSQLMNNLVNLLRKTDHSIYVHTVPSVDASKDFYDDYLNQEVFVMDDVGQQGPSQWRTIINFVSPVKYPLDCAKAENKNTKFFNADLLLCTTNKFTTMASFTKSDCISEPKALFRRAHVFNIEHIEGAEWKQRVTYKKYDHIDSMAWRNEFIYENVHLKDKIKPTCEGTSLECLHYCYQLLRNLQETVNNEVEKCVISEKDLDGIISSVDYFSPQSILSFMVEEGWRNIENGRVYMTEWIEYLMSLVCSFVTTSMESITLFVSDELNFESLTGNKVLVAAISAGIGYFLYNVLSGGQDNEDISLTPLQDFSKWKKLEKTFKTRYSEVHPRYIVPQAGISYPYKQFSKYIVVKSDDGITITHGIVSGENLLLPAHIDNERIVIDVYASWDHYAAGHKELEEVVCIRKKVYYSCDMAVFKFIDLSIPLYKKCKYLFNNVVTHSPELFLINVGFEIPLIAGQNTFLNTQHISYTTVKSSRIVHQPETGYLTPILTGVGLCGTMLVNKEQGIIGMHVAGSVDDGFCVIPSAVIAEDIRKLMHEGRESRFEIDDAIKKDFSGVRLRYEAGDIQKKFPIKETSFVPTLLHRDVAPEVDKLISEINFEGLALGKELVGIKQPPNFVSEGTAIKTLSSVATKSFKHTGHITDAERDFVSKSLALFFTDFDDLTDFDTTFGNGKIQPLNKDSSNGYKCLPNKSDYVDYEHKEHYPIFDELLKTFRNKCINNALEVDDILNVETFKDELRTSNKVNTPRTFRVMPLPHIWWTKKIFGNLMVHFMEHMHDFGICVGFNPFVDMDILVRKLKTCDVTGDADFKQWDGSLSNDLMLLVRDVSLQFYKGKHRAVLSQLFVTMARSPVLIFDSLFLANHGLPSGNWLTLLLNCLINKALTALTIFRNKPNPEVLDVMNIVDYVMGDDKIFGTSGTMSKYYNLFTVKETAESMGMICTNGDKTPITTKSLPLERLSFLKRKFNYHPQLCMYVGALSIDTIMNTIQWYDSSKNYDESVEGKIRSMQVESYLHSEILFEKFSAGVAKIHPYFCMFTKAQVIGILKDPMGYVNCMKLSGKDVSFTGVLSEEF